MKDVRHVQTMALGEQQAMCQMPQTVALAHRLPGTLPFCPGIRHERWCCGFAFRNINFDRCMSVR